MKTYVKKASVRSSVQSSLELELKELMSKKLTAWKPGRGSLNIWFEDLVKEKRKKSEPLISSGVYTRLEEKYHYLKSLMSEDLYKAIDRDSKDWHQLLRDAFSPALKSTVQQTKRKLGNKFSNTRIDKFNSRYDYYRTEYEICYNKKEIVHTTKPTKNKSSYYKNQLYNNITLELSQPKTPTSDKTIHNFHKQLISKLGS